jgi:hypothetical protein
MDNLSKKLASNDKVLETISNKMESFSSAIKNQHSFNKMLEFQISQLASSVLTTNPGKILGQSEELEFANLVDIYSADLCSSKIEEGPRWTDWGMPAKRGDPRRPVITITNGAYTFKNALCNFGSSVNIMPKVIYKKIIDSPLLYTTMCLQLADLSLCHPKGILDNICLGVGRSYVVADFVVVKTGGGENAPIILGCPFLAIAKAIIYADVSKIVFTINRRMERFNFKNKILKAPAHPRYPYPQEHEPVVEKKRRDIRRNKKNNRPQSHVEEVWMINMIQSENENLFPSPLLPKLEDPRVPSIHYSINHGTSSELPA